MSEPNGPPTSRIGQIWKIRYRAYRHKYGRFKAFWRGIVLTELYMMSKGIAQDDLELIEHLLSVEVVAVDDPLGIVVDIDIQVGDGPPAWRRASHDLRPKKDDEDGV